MSTEPRFSVTRSVKIGTFHVGSSMADLLTTGVWNRVMITDLGLAAVDVPGFARRHHGRA